MARGLVQDGFGKATPISRGLFERFTDGVNAQISSLDPMAWMGPSQPMGRVAPRGTQARIFDYRFGQNIDYTPKAFEGYCYDVLRDLADGYSLLRSVIETRKDQVSRVPHSFSVRTLPGEPPSKQKERQLNDKRIAKLEEFWSKPDGQHSFSDWQRQILEDLFVIDAASVVPRWRRDGGIYGFDVIDGATISLLVDETGRSPMPPDPAYRQIIKGMPAVDMMIPTPAIRKSDALFFYPRNVRPSRLYGFCFSPDTEVLTRDGWKLVSAVTHEDGVATRNPDTKALEWQRPTALTKRRYSGNLINFIGKGVDVLVTPEHNMIVRNRNTGHESLLPAQELKDSPFHVTHWQLPLVVDSWAGCEIKEMKFGDKSAIHERNRTIRTKRQAGASYSEISASTGVPVATIADVVTERYTYEAHEGGRYPIEVTMSGDDYCAFMGMYLSEGSTNKGKIVVITQKQSSRFFTKFRDKLEGIFGPVAYDGYDFYIHRTALIGHLKSFGYSHQKYVPIEIMEATSDQIKIFLDYLFDGDARRAPSGQIFYYTTSRRMADQVQELLQKTGVSSTVTPLAPRGSVMADGRVIKAENCRTQYKVSVNKMRRAAASKSKYVPFEGTVNCISVPNKSVLARRNGKATWTSQSPVEQLVLIVNIALRRQMHQLQWYTDGTIPDVFLEAPDGLSEERMTQFEAIWNEKFATTQARRKANFVPFGTKVTFAKDPKLKDEMDEYLARMVAYCFSVSPTALVKTTNRATSQQLSDDARAEGLEPILFWFKEIMDDLLAFMGCADIEYELGSSNRENPLVQAQVWQILLSTVDDQGHSPMRAPEVREELGLEPIDYKAEDDAAFAKGLDQQSQRNALQADNQEDMMRRQQQVQHADEPRPKAARLAECPLCRSGMKVVGHNGDTVMGPHHVDTDGTELLCYATQKVLGTRALKKKSQSLHATASNRALVASGTHKPLSARRTY